jgi:diguanylate cyclase (GGDEF)-like protein
VPEVVMVGERRLVAYIAIQGVAAAGSFALPFTLGRTVRLVIATVGVATIVWAILSRRPGRRIGWWLVALNGAAGFAATIVIATADGLSRAERLRSDVQFALVTVALCALAAGLAVLGWRRAGQRGWDALDASITALGAFLVAWVLYIDPMLAHSPSAFATLITIAVPAALLLVFAMAVNFAFSGAWSTWSGRLLLLSTAASLCTTILVYFGPIERLTVPIGAPIVAIWLGHVILLGGAGIPADFLNVVGSRPRSAPDLPPWRIVIFVVLALLAPLDVAVDFWRGGVSGPRLVAVLVPSITATIILLLVVTRLAVIARVARTRAAELAVRSASLADAMAEQDELQQKLAYRALHDPLTGVANRYILTDRMDRISEHPANRGQALIMLDLDDFKDVNDTYGHPVGDQVLIDVAHRLLRAIPDGSVLVRLGGDEFGILLEDLPPVAARAVAERIVEALRSPFFVAGSELFLSASVGLVVTEAGGHPPRASAGLRDVDQALYAAKAAGRNRVAEFHPRLRDERLRQAHMTTELRHALSQEDLFLHYQPIVALNDGRVVGVEALARWRPRGEELVSPSEFIPVAEQAGLIVDIGTWVLRQACRDAGPWYIEHGLTVGVNVSGRQLDDTAFADIVVATLAEAGLPGSALVLELTESSLIENTADPTVRSQLDRLRDIGVRVAIDDFGTGYSSLSYITRLPVDLVKIDSSFTPSADGAEAPHQPWDVVRAILQLIASLKLSAVAEGIETSEQAEVLRQLNCAEGQGYYFSPPVSADGIDDLLRRWDRRSSDRAVAGPTNRRHER